MYKRLYLGREVPPDRHSHILDTHDIEGAQPKSWVHPDRPFFAKNYPEVHLATQNQQYNDALHQRLLYTKKQNEVEWKYSKKCDYPDAKAKNSEISREQLINRKEDFEDVKRAKELFYARNLRIDDIEGTKPGTLDTKFMKNWALAQEYKRAEADGIRKKPGQSVDIFQKPRNPYPYGDGLNGEDYLPENLKHAREMAHRNRNRLRAEATLNPNFHNRATRPDQRTSMATLIRGEPAAAPQSYALSASHPTLAWQQYSSGASKLQPAEPQVVPSLPQGAGNQTTFTGEIPDLAVAQQRGAQSEENRVHHLDEREIRDPREETKITEDNRERELAREYQKVQAELDWIRGMRERQEREEAEQVAREGRDGRDVREDRGRRAVGYGDPREDNRNMEPPRQVHFEERRYEPSEGQSQYNPTNQRSYNQPDSQAPAYPQSYPQHDANTNPGFSKYGISQKEQEQYFQPSVLNNPPREMFVNQLEQAKYDRLSPEDKKFYMAAFLRGKKGKEFTLEQNNSEKLKTLNDFYSEFLSEQYKRRSPITKDDYTYYTTVNHLKKHGVL